MVHDGVMIGSRALSEDVTPPLRVRPPLSTLIFPSCIQMSKNICRPPLRFATRGKRGAGRNLHGNRGVVVRAMRGTSP